MELPSNSLNVVGGALVKTEQEKQESKAEAIIDSMTTNEKDAHHKDVEHEEPEPLLMWPPNLKDASRTKTKDIEKILFAPPPEAPRTTLENKLPQLVVEAATPNAAAGGDRLSTSQEKTIEGPVRTTSEKESKMIDKEPSGKVHTTATAVASIPIKGKENNGSTPKRSKAKRLWLSLSPSRRKLKQQQQQQKETEEKLIAEERQKEEEKEKAAETQKAERKPESVLASESNQESLVATESNQEKDNKEEARLKADDTKQDSENVVAIQEKQASIIQAIPEKNEEQPADTVKTAVIRKHIITEIEIVTVAEGVDAVKEAERRNFSRAISMDDDDLIEALSDDGESTVKIQNNAPVLEELDLSTFATKNNEEEQDPNKSTIQTTFTKEDDGTTKVEVSSDKEPAREPNNDENGDEGNETPDIVGKKNWWKKTKQSLSFNRGKSKKSKKAAEEPLPQDPGEEEVLDKAEEAATESAAETTTPVEISAEPEPEVTAENLVNESFEAVETTEPVDLDKHIDTLVTNLEEEKETASTYVVEPEPSSLVVGDSVRLDPQVSGPVQHDFSYDAKPSAGSNGLSFLVCAILGLLLCVLLAPSSHLSPMHTAGYLNNACGPISHGTALDGTQASNLVYDAPWWMPHKSKLFFRLLCGDRPRTRLEWIFEKQARRKKLYRLVLSDLDSDGSSGVLLEKRNLVAARVQCGQISVTNKRRKEEVFSAPWYY